MEKNRALVKISINYISCGALLSKFILFLFNKFVLSKWHKIRWLIIFSVNLERIEIDWKFARRNFHPFLDTGGTRPIFQPFEKIAVMKKLEKTRGWFQERCFWLKLVKFHTWQIIYRCQTYEETFESTSI